MREGTITYFLEKIRNIDAMCYVLDLLKVSERLQTAKSGYRLMGKQKV